MVSHLEWENVRIVYGDRCGWVSEIHSLTLYSSFAKISMTRLLILQLCIAGSLSLLMGLYHATWKPAHMKTSPTTPPTTPETTAEKKIAPPEVPPPDTIAAKLIGPHIYLAMFAMWLAVMSHIFLDTVGENPKGSHPSHLGIFN